MNQTEALARTQQLAQSGFDSSYGGTISGLNYQTGKLSATQADSFIQLLVDQTSLSKLATVYRMTTPERRVGFININDDVVRPGTSCTDPGDTANASVSENVLRPQLMRAGATICDEELEDNWEGEGFRDTFMRLLSLKIGNRLEQAFLMGKKLANPANAATIEGLVNGWYTSTVAAGHVIDGSTLGDGVAAANTPYLTTAKLNKTIKTIPDKYFGDVRQIKFMLSRGVFMDFVSLIGNRATPLGDTAFLAGRSPLSYATGEGMMSEAINGSTGMGWGDIEAWRVSLLPTNVFRPKASGTITTTLSAPMAVGATTATLTASTGIAVGEVVKLAGNAADTAQDETLVVTANNTGTGVVTFSTASRYAHSSANVAVSGTGDGTFMLATPQSNLAVGIRRDINIEWWRRPDLAAWKVYVSIRVDSLLINPDAAVVITNMAVSPL